MSYVNLKKLNGKTFFLLLLFASTHFVANAFGCAKVESRSSNSSHNCMRNNIAAHNILNLKWINKQQSNKWRLTASMAKRMHVCATLLSFFFLHMQHSLQMLLFCSCCCLLHAKCSAYPVCVCNNQRLIDVLLKAKCNKTHVLLLLILFLFFFCFVVDDLVKNRQHIIKKRKIQICKWFCLNNWKWFSGCSCNVEKKFAFRETL